MERARERGAEADDRTDGRFKDGLRRNAWGAGRGARGSADVNDELRSIRVDLDVVPLPSYSTAAEAIAADEVNPRAPQAKSDSLLVGGAAMTDFAVSDRVIRLYLSNGHVLEVVATNKGADWQVSRPASGNDHMVSMQYTPVRLLWPSGRSTLYDPTSYLACRKQHVVRELYAGQVFLNVYFVHGGALRFGAIWNSSDRGPLLYVSELEPMKDAKGANAGA